MELKILIQRFTVQDFLRMHRPPSQKHSEIRNKNAETLKTKNKTKAKGG
jgi:hypothetical protein